MLLNIHWSHVPDLWSPLLFDAATFSEQERFRLESRSLCDCLSCSLVSDAAVVPPRCQQFEAVQVEVEDAFLILAPSRGRTNVPLSADLPWRVEISSLLFRLGNPPA
jgi:hypothetical protein